MSDRRDVLSQPYPVRLDSWKDIAAFFGRDARTVRRWEAERGLPVRRVPGHARGRVFAYVADLQTWLDTAGDEPVETAESAETASSPFAHPAAVGFVRAAVEPDPAEELDLAVANDAVPGVDAPSTAPQGRFPVATVPRHAEPPRRWRRWMVGASFLVVVAGAAIVESDRRDRTASPHHTVPTQAEDLYLRGRYALSLRTEASLNEAVDLFTRSLQVDPDDAAAYAGLADSHILLRQFGNVPDMEAFSKALAANERAVALDPTSVEAVRTHAFLLNYWRWDFPAADREFQRAIALDPTDVQSHHWYATSLWSAGHFREALAQIEIARRLQPDSVPVLANRGFLMAVADPVSALTELRELEVRNPQFPMIHRYLGMVHFQLGHPGEGIGEMRQAAAMHGDAEAVAVIDEATRALADHGEGAMLRTMGRGLGRMADRYAIDPLKPAYYYARLRDAERTLHYLTLSYDRHGADFVDSATNPVYAFLHGAPAFEALQRRRQSPPADAASAAGAAPPPHTGR